MSGSAKPIELIAAVSMTGWRCGTGDGASTLTAVTDSTATAATATTVLTKVRTFSPISGYPTKGCIGFASLKVTKATAVAPGSGQCQLVLTLIIAWYGGLKFMDYEGQGIRPLVSESPVMSWLCNICSALLGVFGVARARRVRARGRGADRPPALVAEGRPSPRHLGVDAGRRDAGNSQHSRRFLTG